MEDGKTPKDTAYAVATQQAHAVKKSPKDFRTSTGVRTAKKKYDTPKVMLKTARVSGLFDELEKIGTRSLAKDFIAGADPTGIVTSRYGMDDVRSGRGRSSAAQAVGDVGGAIGGAIAIPAVIGGLIGAAKGGATAKGGVASRLVGVGRGAVSGAVGPYRNLFHAVRGGHGLAATKAGKAMTENQAKSLHALVKDAPGLEDFAAKTAPSHVNRVVKRMSPEQLERARRVVRGEAVQGGTALGLSGVIGAASAHMQYGKGAETQESLNEQLGRARAKSITLPSSPSSFVGYRGSGV
jgi:hypothetical protein